MVPKVCVACNMKVVGTNKACVRCGHVLTEKRTIGGRRYSEYRANLYLRLMNRKLRRHGSFLKEAHLKSSALPELVSAADSSTRIKSRRKSVDDHEFQRLLGANLRRINVPSRVSPASVQFTVNKTKPKPATLLKLVQEETNATPRKDHQMQEETGDQRSESKYFMRPKAVSMETKRRLTENPVRFTLALAEINRRILSQQLMWFNL